MSRFRDNLGFESASTVQALSRARSAILQFRYFIASNGLRRIYVTPITSASGARCFVFPGRRTEGCVVALQDDGSIDPANSGALLRGILPAFGLDRAAKRLAEIGAATAGLILFSPLLLLAGIAIRLDSRGPILISETRYGYQNRPIRVLKFRLVEACAESALMRSRQTRVGQILGRTGVDELPRLVNVLLGEMAIFGPPPSAHPKASLSRAKPGMIHWAQIIATRDGDLN
jgi:Bacterial sugar transferase